MEYASHNWLHTVHPVCQVVGKSNSLSASKQNQWKLPFFFPTLVHKGEMKLKLCSLPKLRGVPTTGLNLWEKGATLTPFAGKKEDEVYKQKNNEPFSIKG